MANKETKPEKIEKEYVIPLRKEWKKVPRYKRANKAIKAIKEFLVKHMKIRDRDLKKIKVDKYLNEAIWFRGIKNPPIKIKVKARKEGDNIIAELSDMPEKLKFKKLREDDLPRTHKQCSHSKSLEIKENKLLCAFGINVSECEILQSLETEISKDLAVEEQDKLKAYTCCWHIFDNFKKLDTSEGYLQDESDRMYWKNVYKSMTMDNE